MVIDFTERVLCLFWGTHLVLFSFTLLLGITIISFLMLNQTCIPEINFFWWWSFVHMAGFSLRFSGLQVFMNKKGLWHSFLILSLLLSVSRLYWSHNTKLWRFHLQISRPICMKLEFSILWRNTLETLHLTLFLSEWVSKTFISGNMEVEISLIPSATKHQKC